MFLHGFVAGKASLAHGAVAAELSLVQTFVFLHALLGHVQLATHRAAKPMLPPRELIRYPHHAMLKRQRNQSVSGVIKK